MRLSVSRHLLRCLIILFLTNAGFALAEAMRSADSHGPPWNGAVASTKVLRIGSSTLQIDFGPGDMDLSQDAIVRWVQTAGQAIATYFGKFPVARARILVVPIAGERGVLTGTTWGDVGGFPAFTRMRLGQHTTAEDLQSDWTMTHEFVHISFPSLSEKHHWLEEGLATYVEPIARVQIGTLTPKQIWGDMHRDMRKGEPGPSDKGLDQTHTWASTYWGGALFCLIADVKIRQETSNRKGLQDALQAVLSAGGTIDQDWPIAKIFTVGDKATGTSVLSTLYYTMGENPEPVDLAGIWKELGVRVENGDLVFDNKAPLASIRERITSPALQSSEK
jgi:hypothetical protein